MKSLPDFSTLDEAVEFWETHDSADYLDELAEVEFESDLHQNLFHSGMITLTHRPDHCPRCKSELDAIVVEYADWSDHRLRIIRDVPALRCRANGHEYLLEVELDRIERLLELEREHQLQPAETITVPVFDFDAAV